MAGEKKTARNTWASYRKQSEALRKKVLVLAADARALGNDPDADPVSGSDAISAEVSCWEAALGPLADELRTILARLEPEQKRTLESLDQQLMRELKSQGHAVHGETSLLIVDGVVHVEIDSKQRKVTVNGAPTNDLAVSTVVAAITGETQRLAETQTAPAEMLEQLAVAYDREIRANERAQGSQIQTAAVLLQIALLRQSASFRSNPTARAFREYPREVFRADLYRLMASGEFLIKQRRFKFASGSDVAGALFMLVPSLGRTAHVGRISFEAVG